MTTLATTIAEIRACLSRAQASSWTNTEVAAVLNALPALLDAAEVVSGLPRTADGVQIHPGTTVYTRPGDIRKGDKGFEYLFRHWQDMAVSNTGKIVLWGKVVPVFSTREAAEAAHAGGGGGC